MEKNIITRAAATTENIANFANGTFGPRAFGFTNRSQLKVVGVGVLAFSSTDATTGAATPCIVVTDAKGERALIYINALCKRHIDANLNEVAKVGSLNQWVMVNLIGRNNKEALAILDKALADVTIKVHDNGAFIINKRGDTMPTTWNEFDATPKKAELTAKQRADYTIKRINPETLDFE